MISSQDRSGWLGASDTSYVMGNWQTATFKKWWMQKLGMNTDHFTNAAMNAGTYYEHAILDAVGAPRRDHQILLPELKLRVNLDGDGPGKIYEVKTHSVNKPFKVTKAYWRQVQVQQYAKSVVEKVVPKAVIVAYGLEEADYRNYFNDIDPARLHEYPVPYDPAFIAEYLPRLKYLGECLEKGVFPDEESYRNRKG